MACGNPEEFPKKPFGSSASGSTEIQGFTQLFHIFGNHRNIEVELRLTLVELTCRVFNFEVRLLPDYRQQVIVDKDAGDVRVM